MMLYGDSDAPRSAHMLRILSVDGDGEERGFASGEAQSHRSHEATNVAIASPSVGSVNDRSIKTAGACARASTRPLGVHEPDAATSNASDTIGAMRRGIMRILLAGLARREEPSDFVERRNTVQRAETRAADGGRRARKAQQLPVDIAAGAHTIGPAKNIAGAVVSSACTTTAARDAR